MQIKVRFSVQVASKWVGKQHYGSFKGSKKHSTTWPEESELLKFLMHCGLDPQMAIIS